MKLGGFVLIQVFVITIVDFLRNFANVGMAEADLGNDSFGAIGCQNMEIWDLELKFSSAMALYRAGDYEKSIDAFSEIIDVLPEEWNSRLYLAMASYRLDRHSAAYEQMQFIKLRCPDPTIRAQAERSAALMNSVMTRPVAVPAPPEAPKPKAETRPASSVSNTSTDLLKGFFSFVQAVSEPRKSKKRRPEAASNASAKSGDSDSTLSIDDADDSLDLSRYGSVGESNAWGKTNGAVTEDDLSWR